MQHVDTRNWVVGQDVLPAPDITALINRYTRFAAPLRDRLVGQLARRAGRTRDPSGEMKMGNLVADAQRAATGAQRRVREPGHRPRGAARPATITYGRAFTTQPFGTTLVTMTMSGSQIHEMLKQQWCGRDRPGHPAAVRERALLVEPRDREAMLGVACADAPDPIIDLRDRRRAGAARRGVPGDRQLVARQTAGTGSRSCHGANDPIDGDGDADALAELPGADSGHRAARAAGA